MIKLSPIVRLAMGVTLLTSSVLLVLDMLGFVPDQTEVEYKSTASFGKCGKIIHVKQK